MQSLECGRGRTCLDGWVAVDIAVFYLDAHPAGIGPVSRMGLVALRSEEKIIGGNTLRSFTGWQRRR